MQDLHPWRRLVDHFPHLPEIPGEWWVVGGAVRDLLMGLSPMDVDLAARQAEAVARDFGARVRGRVVDLGKEVFPTWRVVVRGSIYDFTELTGETINEDLGRRDFTLNAMALAAATDTVIDPFDGRRDIAARLVRMLSVRNLLDDPLRMLKGIRTAVVLGFEIDGQTLEAFCEYSAAIESVAGERVTAELERMWSIRAGRALALLRESQLDGHVLTRPLAGDDERWLRSTLLESGVDPALILTLLTDGMSDGAVSEELERGRWGTKRIRRVLAVRHLVAQLRDREDVLWILRQAGAETVGHAVRYLELRGDRGLSERIGALLSQTPSLFTAEPYLDGEQIGRISGVPPGPEIGELKRRLFQAQLAGEVRSPAEAAEWVERNGSSRGQ